MEKTKFTLQALLSISLLCLALAIAYTGYEVHNLCRGFPEVLTQMQKTSEAIYPTIKEISAISKNIPPIAGAIDKMSATLPPVIEEIKATRESLPDNLKQVSLLLDKTDHITDKIPEVLVEVRKTREEIPGILSEVHRINEEIPSIITQVNGIREKLPEMIQTVDKASDSVRSFSIQLSETNKMIPDILEETRKTREALPVLMDRAEKIVTQGQEFGSEAGKGAISGFVMSVVNPMNVGGRLKDLVLPGKEAPALTEADIALIRETVIDAITNKKPGEEVKWENPASKDFGKVTLLREYFEGDEECNEIRAEIWVKKSFWKNEKTHDFNMIFCKKPDGTWAEKGKPVLNK